MSDTLIDESRRARSTGDRYLALLAVVLLGYALMGRGFAYLGFPPLYVGEIAFLAGIVTFLRSGAVVASLATLPALVLVVTMVWVVARTIPFVGVHGIDALRDSVIILYGGFAFIVVGLLLEDARRIATALRYYGVLLTTLPVMAAGFWLTKYWADEIPRLPGSTVPILEVGAGAVGTHLAGTAVFVLIGYRKVSPLWVAVWVATLLMVISTTRGATLAVFVPIVLAMLVLGRLRLMFTIAATALGILGVLFAAEAMLGQYKEAEDSIERPVSAHQIVENAKSIVGHSGQQTEGTIRWRLGWWDVIVNDTIHGPHFWTGRGFGLNLAYADGFATPGDPDHPRAPNRSPHNAHITLLARAGVPGVMLWSLVLVSWSGMMLRAMLSARVRGHKQWADLFLFVICYVAAILINATFDVVLEGPMQGIWFWCLFGFGIGSVMVYRAQTTGVAGSASR